MTPDRPLFDPARAPAVDPADAVAIVHRFLDRCAAWGAEREIPARLERMRAEPTPENAAKLHAWASWVAFVRHAQQELESGALDRWFTEAPGADGADRAAGGTAPASGGGSSSDPPDRDPSPVTRKGVGR